MQTLKRFVFALVATTIAWPALASHWLTWSKPENAEVHAGIRQDDGAVIVTCDSDKRLTILVVEPRANFTIGEDINVVFRADDSRIQPDTARATALSTTQVLIDESPAVDLFTMDKGATSFTVDVGGQTRTFSTTDLRTATDPVLRACGDHW